MRGKIFIAIEVICLKRNINYKKQKVREKYVSKYT